MSSKTAFLALRLEGPFQSWGYDSQFDYRKTGLFPTKSAIAGMCCAAMGISRGSEEEMKFLKRFGEVNMLAVSIPRRGTTKDNASLEVRRLRDYHTVQGTRKASGGIKETHLTYRFYLQDAAFAVILSGDHDFLNDIAYNLRDPKWGLWLGRKCCLPTAPVFTGIHETESEALCLLLNGRKLEEFTHQREVSEFKAGNDTLPDQPVSFGSAEKDREFAPRRVELREAK
jgi:CRISPR system Cascade subunit CasD